MKLEGSGWRISFAIALFFVSVWGYASDGLGFYGETNEQTSLYAGMRFKGEALSTISGKTWAMEIVFQAVAPDGRLSGEIAWPSLNCRHRIEGLVRDGELVFTEVSAIQPGAAHLQVSYRLAVNCQNLSGTWNDPAGDEGTVTASLFGETPGADMSGIWRFGSKGEYWTLTRMPDGRYRAQEHGFGNASGTATFTGRDFRLDFTFSGGSGYFVGVLAPDRRTIKAVRHHDMVDFTFEFLRPLDEASGADATGAAPSPESGGTGQNDPGTGHYPGSGAGAGTLATDQFHWKRVDNTRLWGKTYSFRITGPMTITFRCVIQPFDGLVFFNQVVSVFRHNFSDGMEYLKGGETFDGKPLESYNVSSSNYLYRKVQLYHGWSTWKLPAGHSFEARVEVGAPGNDAGAWYQHAADAWFEVVIGDAGAGSSPVPGQSGTVWNPDQGTAPAMASGSYKLDANNYSGKIEIDSSASPWKVKIRYDLTGNWETMTEVSFDAVSGTLTFVRPWSGNPRFQVYTGKISGSTITGTFTDHNSPGKSFPWTMSR